MLSLKKSLSLTSLHKQLLISLSLIIFTASAAIAMPPPPEHHRVKHLSNSLSLSAEQQDNLHTIMDEHRKLLNANIEGILTATQLEKFKKQKSPRRGERSRHKGPGGCGAKHQERPVQ